MKKTLFQHAVVMATAAAVIVELLFPSLTAHERPDILVTGLRVLATLVAGATLAWVSVHRVSAVLVAAVAAATLLGMTVWPDWQQARADAARRCEEARRLSVGEIWWGETVKSIAVITAPDAGRWAEPPWGQIASGRMPPGWRIETVPVPMIVVVEDRPPGNPQAHLVGIGAVTHSGWDSIMTTPPDWAGPLDPLLSQWVRPLDPTLPPGWKAVERDPLMLQTLPGSTWIAETTPLMSQITALLRLHYPQYNAMSDQDFAQRLWKRLLFVGGPAKELAGAFCSKVRLWSGW